jgi:type IV pilus assembly protein PilC
MEWVLVSWPTLLLLALGLRMALRLHYGARGPDAGDPIHDFVSVFTWVLFSLAILPIFGWWLLAPHALLMIVAAAIMGILLAVTLVEVVTQHRAAQRRSVCSLLALFLERRRQLETSLLLSAQTLRGRVGRAAERLFSALSVGVPLATAVRDNPTALPPEAIAYLAAGQTMQVESAALRELSQTDHSEMTVLWRACIDRISYLSCVVLFMFAALTFLMIRIVPEFRSIFQEFDVDLPTLTVLAISLSDSFLKHLAVPVGMILFVAMAAASTVGACYLLDINVLSGLTDRIFRGRRTADVLRILAVATEQRRPIAETLYRVAQVYPSSAIRRQVVPAAAAVVAGGGWQDALFRVGVVNSGETALLLSAERAGNLPWALRQVAKRREKRAVYRMATALQILYPAVILLLGGIVAFYVVSLFFPLVKLINGLSK